MILRRPSRAKLAALTSEEKDALIYALFDIMEAQELRIAALERRLGLDSTNSSKPPSSDGLKKKPVRVRSLRVKSGKTSGGQKGHKGETLKQIAHPDEVVEHTPEHCVSCGNALAGFSADGYKSRQVFDIAPPQIVVTEHRAIVKKCTCGSLVKGAFPDGVNAPAQYGPRVTNVSVYLAQAQFIPEDRLQETLRDLFGIAPATATLVNMQTQTAARLEDTMKAVGKTVHAAPVKHLDETGFRIGGKTCWMHTVSTDSLTRYRAEEKRGALPEDLIGIAVHDHWKPYYKLPDVSHALCNAHHLRELKALIEIEQEGWARNMDKLLRCMAQLVRKDTNKTVSPPVIARAEGLYERIILGGLMFHESQPPLPKAKQGRQKRRTGHNLLIRLRDYKADVLRFLYDPAVPFTNNQAEQDLRMVKLRQKISGGFRTFQGAQTFATIRSFISSARKQNLNIIAALQNHSLLAV